MSADQLELIPVTMQEFDEFVRDHGVPAELLEMRYMGKTLWRPDEPALEAAE